MVLDCSLVPPSVLSVLYVQRSTAGALILRVVKLLAYMYLKDLRSNAIQ